MKISKKILCVTSVFLLCVLCVFGCSLKGEGEFLVKEHLDDVVVKINDKEFTYGDIGYYIANGESAIEAQALLYNPDNPQEYWNKHTNGVFIKVQTRQTVMDNFVRDTIIAMEAKEQGISLSDNEKENCRAASEASFEQLNDYQKEAIGMTVDKLNEVMENAYLGQLYINEKLQNNGSDYTVEDWVVGGVCYEGLLSEYKVKVNNKNWEKAEFGKITIER